MHIETENGMHLYTGVLTRDPDFQIVGAKNSHRCSLDIAMHKASRDLPSEYVNHITLWRSDADLASMLRKGDSVLITGHFEEREWNGKVLRDFVCDLLYSPSLLAQSMGVKQTAGSVGQADSQPVQTLGDRLSGGTTQAKRSLPSDVLEETDWDESLPF